MECHTPTTIPESELLARQVADSVYRLLRDKETEVIQEILATIGAVSILGGAIWWSTRPLTRLNRRTR